MKTLKTGVMLLALLLAAMAMVPMVNAVENVKLINFDTTAPKLTKLVDNPEAIAKSCPVVQNQEAVINSLIGKDISVADFYEKIYPGCIAKLPTNVQETYKKQKMTWPQLSTTPLMKSMSEEESAGIISTLKKKVSSGNFVPGVTLPSNAALSETVSLNGISVAWKGPTTIYQSSTTTDPNSVAMTYMSTKSNLYMLQNGNFVNIANKQTIGAFVSSQTAQGIKAVDPGLFQVLGEHYGIAPLGYVPTEVYGYSTSQYFTVP